MIAINTTPLVLDIAHDYDYSCSMYMYVHVVRDIQAHRL